LKELKGFLGLVDYYRKFIRRFGIISKPLIDLLKKNDFKWHEEKHEAFDLLKNILCDALVLALPNFTKTFALEIDPSAISFEAVLNHEDKPLAFLSKALGIRHLGLSIYEKRVFDNSNGNRKIKALFGTR
jgi:hypothetical protein